MNTKKRVCSLLVLGIALILSSCAGEDDGSEEMPPASVVGTWEVLGSSLEINDQTGTEFADDVSACFRDQGGSTTSQDVLDNVTENVEFLVGESELVSFKQGVRFVFSADNSYSLQTADDSGSGTWQIDGGRLTFDNNEIFAFNAVVDSDQLLLTDLYQYSGADYTDSGYAPCTDRLDVKLTTQLSRR